ncbi:MAG: serine/threonine protein kinase [Planctomycetaceae bacterium]|nr:serine/threonine protein kinase [Planctomycetaceae bacterium]
MEEAATLVRFVLLLLDRCWELERAINNCWQEELAPEVTIQPDMEMVVGTHGRRTAAPTLADRGRQGEEMSSDVESRIGDRLNNPGKTLSPWSKVNYYAICRGNLRHCCPRRALGIDRTMENSDSPEPVEVVPPDLVPVIRRSGVLTDRQLKEVSAKVLRGEYPRGSSDLAEQLVNEGILTEFQVHRLLRNKPHGLVVGPYVILERLGAGSMGRVFKAQHRLMGRTVALKLIAPEKATRPNAMARFHREMRLIGRLDHPNVVRAFDADQFGKTLYIVMEYVTGKSLDILLDARGPLPPAEVVDYASQAALGLGHAHSQGIVHRDIKPSNLMVSESGQVKILDLGLSAFTEVKNQASFETAAGHVVGTIDYMSPEQAMGCDLDGRSDLFSLGCTMFLLMTGQFPFSGDTAFERIVQRVKGRPIPILQVCPDLQPSLVEILDKLLAHRPEDRFQTAVEASDAMQSWMHHKTAFIPACRSTPPQESPPPGPESAAHPEPIAASDPPSPGDIPHVSSLSRWTRPLASLGAQKISLIVIMFLFIELIIFGAGFTLGYLSRNFRNDTKVLRPASQKVISLSRPRPIST